MAHAQNKSPLVKSPEAYRTISEVAMDLDLPQHVLRFWETRFPQIRPMKKGGGRRYYRMEDIELIKGIRAALYGDGLTIRGVLKRIKEEGVEEIITMGQQPFNATPQAKKAMLEVNDDALDEPYSPRPTASNPPKVTFNSLYGTGVSAMSFGRGLSSPLAQPVTQRASPLVKFAPLEDEPEDLPAFIPRTAAPPRREAEVKVASPAPASPQKPKFSPLPQEGYLSMQDVQKLQQALNDLVECRRLLD